MFNSRDSHGIEPLLMSDAMLYGIIFISYEQLIQVNPEVDEYKLAYAQVTIQSRSASLFCKLISCPHCQ